jgi:DNA-binding MarR family transcriptional regulator
MPRCKTLTLESETRESAGDLEEFEFHSEPGHLIRRLHQIATSMFLEQSRSLGVTPVQYAALNAIRRHPDHEQREIARLIAIDRTTINIVTKKLEERGWVKRRPLGRAVHLVLTTEGDRVLCEMGRLTAGHGEQLLAPLDPEERKTFVLLLERLVDNNNALSRVPMQMPVRRQGAD